MKDCGGCLGPVVGHQPDLGNLQYSISIVSRFSIKLFNLSLHMKIYLHILQHNLQNSANCAALAL